eukprot:CAMPEP_0202967844 /NCGR_PEP_ID=MMETSP1396-20130829/12870_1 /ASSEMBLY_ACC=CAM_ASM_000872 /TAXON_ID= /ORGANISM="Pseudokeronopsis sp., Strain Brazil" /LENGTH=75 /DNA_ID=CAMNT_0049693391 /DNA_START=446 /DNA_END=673 /DNA_ORIENTATION=-
MTFEKEIDGGDYREDPILAKLDDDFYDTLADEFLDAIFGEASKMPRKQYIETVTTNAPYIFNSTKVRSKVTDKLG